MSPTVSLKACFHKSQRHQRLDTVFDDAIPDAFHFFERDFGCVATAFVFFHFVWQVVVNHFAVSRNEVKKVSTWSAGPG